jgi:hypothetical protein
MMAFKTAVDARLDFKKEEYQKVKPLKLPVGFKIESEEETDDGVVIVKVKGHFTIRQMRETNRREILQKWIDSVMKKAKEVD